MNRNRWEEVVTHYNRLRNRTAFDLSAECIVINQDGDLFETTLSGLSSHMRVSSALSSPQMKQYKELASEIGAEAAMNKMIEAMDGEAETFCELWAESKKDIANDTLGTVDDVVQATSIAKDGFNAYPRKMLVVELGQVRATLMLVSPPTKNQS